MAAFGTARVILVGHGKLEVPLRSGGAEGLTAALAELTGGAGGGRGRGGKAGYCFRELGGTHLMASRSVHSPASVSNPLLSPHPTHPTTAAEGAAELGDSALDDAVAAGKFVFACPRAKVRKAERTNT